MRDSFDEFMVLYEQRPLRDNQGGMGIPHMFLSWFALKKLQPKMIVESGVWLGQGTWFFEQVCPNATLFCIEPEYDRIHYKSPKATYYQKDFSEIYWGNLPKEDTLLFFDDHQNSLRRIKMAHEYGFRHLMFEDNYPAQKGDCYSPKKIFANAGYSPYPHQSLSERVVPNSDDADYLREVLEVYHELPPIVQPNITRWGDDWVENYPTPDPLYTDPPVEYNGEGKQVVLPQQIHLDEFLEYTWICYVKLKEKEFTNV